MKTVALIYIYIFLVIAYGVIEFNSLKNDTYGSSRGVIFSIIMLYSIFFRSNFLHDESSIPPVFNLIMILLVLAISIVLAIYRRRIQATAEDNNNFYETENKKLAEKEENSQLSFIVIAGAVFLAVIIVSYYLSHNVL